MPKVRIFHEWLDTIGGAEAVLLDLIAVFPDAEIYTLWAEEYILETLGITAKTSFLQFFPKKFRRLAGIPFMPLAWRVLSRSVSAEDLSITSSWVFAHCAIPKKHEQRSIHYIHTPARYLWNPEIDSRTKFQIPLIVLLILRRIDRYLANNHLNVIANSNATRVRIEKFWNLQSVVVHPGVDTDFFHFAKVADLENRKDFILCVGRFVPYKGHSKAIELGEFLNLPVVLVGHGAQEDYLKRLADQSDIKVEILVNPSREKVRSLYATCFFVVYPAIEDFGIVAVEAMACGTPVLGISAGGLLDIISSTDVGVLVSNTEIETLAKGFHQLNWESREEIREHSLKFARDKFRKSMYEYAYQIESSG